MALHKAGNEIPPGAIKLSEEDAILHQWELIRNWSPARDVLPLRYGSLLLAVSCVASAAYINGYYRSKLYLGNIGKLSTYLPIVVLPSFVSTLCHQQEIASDIVIEKTPCPVCVQLRSAGLQVAVSTGYPAILASLSSFVFAGMYGTYDVPPASKPLKVFKFWQKMTRPIGGPLLYICAVQFILGMAVAYYEQDSYMKLRSQLLAKERQSLR